MTVSEYVGQTLQPSSLLQPNKSVDCISTGGTEGTVTGLLQLWKEGFAAQVQPGRLPNVLGKGLSPCDSVTAHCAVTAVAHALV